MVVKPAEGVRVQRSAAGLCVGISSVGVTLEASVANVALRDGGMKRSADEPTNG